MWKQRNSKKDSHDGCPFSIFRNSGGNVVSDVTL